MLKDLHLLEAGLFYLVFKDVLEVFLLHDSKVAVLGCFNSGGSQHRLVVFQEGLFSEGLARTDFAKLSKHGNILALLSNDDIVRLGQLIQFLLQVFHSLALKVQ